MQDASSAPAGKLPSPRRLKNEARQLQRQQPGLDYRDALNVVAKRHGFPTYKHFERAALAQNGSTFAHQVTLCAQWAERPGGQRGLMSAHIQLSEPWANFLTLDERRGIWGQRAYQISRGNRGSLVAKEPYASRESCISNLSKAARQLVFVDAVRLRPASLARTAQAFGGDPHGLLAGRFPNSDHETLWHDPTSGAHLILNEPYQVDAERQGAALAACDMVALTARTWTTHNPEGTLAQLIAPVKDQPVLERLFARAKSLPARFARIVFTDEEDRPFEPFASLRRAG